LAWALSLGAVFLENPCGLSQEDSFCPERTYAAHYIIVVPCCSLPGILAKAVDSNQVRRWPF